MLPHIAKVFDQICKLF